MQPCGWSTQDGMDMAGQGMPGGFSQIFQVETDIIYFSRGTFILFCSAWSGWGWYYGSIGVTWYPCSFGS